MKNIRIVNKINKNWFLKYNGQKIKASVPGDITIDIYNSGIIDNPYYGDNHKKCVWIPKTDFTYECELDISEEIYSKEVVELIFKGIDLFSTISINGVELGKTKNMFLKYKYDIKPYIHVGKNILNVDMKSTLNMMDTFDCKDYFSIFNTPRIFIRKAQCHFGWDWAPKICGYGIWDDVILDAHDKKQINNVKVVAKMNGSLTFFMEMNHNVNASNEDTKEYLRVSVSKTPTSNEYETKEIMVSGINNFVNFTFDKPELWWPVGYGEHPLYRYKIELIQGDNIYDIKEGKFGFRDVELKEEPVSDTVLGFTFYVNGVPIFAKGSNWVPIECFTGVVEDQKYKDLIQLAVEGNLNILRVWGGGIYEKDIFYDLCDENGLLVWQDICLACADIPEEDPEFVSNLLEEVEYQVKRLRNHPSLIYWCGGNEKTGSYGLMITHGDFMVNNILYGVIMHLDDTRSYRRQSPYSYTDFGNEKKSGESHHNVFEASLTEGMDGYRARLAKDYPPFVSECAIMGPSSLETMKKFIPSENLWPMDEMWKDRLMENPYGIVPLDFPHRELKYAQDLYGEVNSIEQFIPKAMMVHAECMRAECEYARAHKGFNSGFLSWMYSDIWPSGTWAVVDYYLEPKQVYYQCKRSFAPIYSSFFEDGNGNTCLFFVNDTNNVTVSSLTIYEKTFDGEEVFKKVIPNAKVGTKKAFIHQIHQDVNKDDYLVVEYFVNDQKCKTIYSKDMFAFKKFDDDFEYGITVNDLHHISLKIKANSFIKSLFIHFEDNYLYQYSDNYLDLEKGDEVVVEISSIKEIDISKIMLDAYKG